MNKPVQKQISILIAVFAAVLIGASQLSFRLPSTPAPVVTTSSKVETPAALPQSTQPVTILKNRAYTVGYSEKLKDPLWVAYSLSQANANDERIRRPRGGFEPDERTQAKITTHDYVNSGYDRGHMAPSYAIGKFHGRDAQVETFVMSNVVPQSHFSNDGVWNSLERMEANDFTKRFASIEVVDGPVFDSNPIRFPSGVAIPTAFYKVIRRPDGEMIAFLVPQYPQSAKPEDYLTSVSEIQNQTGIDPFPSGSAEQKAKIRKSIW